MGTYRHPSPNAGMSGPARGRDPAPCSQCVVTGRGMCYHLVCDLGLLGYVKVSVWFKILPNLYLNLVSNILNYLNSSKYLNCVNYPIIINYNI